MVAGSRSSVAENVIASGTTMKISAGTSLVSIENLVIKNGATLSNTGSVILKKNLNNENAAPNSIGNGMVEMSGTIPQIISGQNILHNFTVNNANGITNSGETRINGVLTLASGKISLGSCNILLGPAATIVGSPSAVIMIIATGSGQLRKEFPVGYTGAFTFPVGDDTGIAEYSPVTISINSAGFETGNYFGVNLVNAKYPDPGITGNYINRYWTITQTGVSDPYCQITFQYAATDVTGDESLLSCTRVNPNPWTTFSLADPALHQLTANGVFVFGAFTGIKSTTIPPGQELQNITLGNGVTNCYDATQLLTVAGNGTTFIVENGGHVTLVAGLKISFLPGTKVNSGGVLHGYITTNNTYCGSTLNPLVANNRNFEEALDVETLIKSRFIKVYPNPTTDVVIVELTEYDATTTANISIYSMQGDKLLHKSIRGESRFQCSLLGNPAGMYMIRVQSGDRSEIAKVIKTN